MSYSEEFIDKALVPSTTNFMTACNLAASTGDYGLWYVGEQVVLTRLQLIVSTTLVADVTAPVLTFYARPTFGTTTGQVSLGTLTIPDLTAAGKILYKNIESVKVPQGYTIAVNRSTQASSSGTAAGAGFVMVKGFVAVEDPRNVSLMIASA
jgi:hypothetical protein